MLHRHPEFELELFHLERRNLERDLTLARQLGEGGVPSSKGYWRVVRRIAWLPAILRRGLKARSAARRSALPAGQLVEGAE